MENPFLLPLELRQNNQLDQLLEELIHHFFYFQEFDLMHNNFFVLSMCQVVGKERSLLLVAHLLYMYCHLDILLFVHVL